MYMLASLLSEAAVPRADFHMSRETRHHLFTAHAILMVLAWLFFVPSAMLFARMLKDYFQDKKPFGLGIWFHVHRNFNIIAILMMAASLICVFCACRWEWKGMFSTSHTLTKWHASTGIFAVALAVVQPFLSLLRCAPSDSRRPIFNWVHRIIGFTAYFLALVALMVFVGPTSRMVMTGIPTLMMLILWPVTSFLLPGPNSGDDEEKKQAAYSLRTTLCFMAIGMMLAVSLALCLLIGLGDGDE